MPPSTTRKTSLSILVETRIKLIPCRVPDNLQFKYLPQNVGIAATIPEPPYSVADRKCKNSSPIHRFLDERNRLGNYLLGNFSLNGYHNQEQ